MKRKLFICAAALTMLAASCKEEQPVQVPDDPQEEKKELKVTAIDPSSAFAGEDVVIKGENFGTDAELLTVTFGAGEADIRSAADNALTVIVPEGEGNVDVYVVKGDEKAGPLAFAYKVAEEPEPEPVSVAVTGIDVLFATAGDEVVITGSGFNADASKNTVKVGDAAVEIVSASETELKVKLPSLAKGDCRFTVEVENGAAPAESDAFVYYYIPRYTVSDYAGDGSKAVAAGTLETAQFWFPHGLAYSPDGKLWVTHRNASAISVVDDAADEVTLFKGQNEAAKNPFGCTYSNGVFYAAMKGSGQIGMAKDGEWSVFKPQKDGADYSLNNPMDIKDDAEGNLYVMERNPGLVTVVKDGNYVRSIDLTAAVEGFQGWAMGFDPAGRYLFVGTNNKAQLLMVDVTTDEVKVIAGSGVATSADTFTDGEPGNPLTATVGQTTGICCSADGYVYFSDCAAARVRVLVPGLGGDWSKGMVRTVAGTLISSEGADGVADSKTGDGLTEAVFGKEGVANIVVANDGSLIVAGDKRMKLWKLTPVTE